MVQQKAPYPNALRCQRCGWYDGQAGKIVRVMDCGDVICQSCCCEERGGNHTCRCGDDTYNDYYEEENL